MQLWLSLFCLLAAYFVLTGFIFSHQELIIPLYLLRISMLIASGGFILLALKKAFSDPKASVQKKGLLTSFLVLVVLVNSLEIIFMFIPKSQGPNMAYASRTWFAYYWRNNSNGFRELNFSELDPETKKIVFIGDSYTAGHGIRDAKERLSGIIQQRVSGAYQCVNLGKNGTNTSDQLKLAEKLPVQPDITVICHVLNDADYLMSEPNNFVDRQFYAQSLTERMLELFGKNSFVCNFLYWHIKAHQNFVRTTDEWKHNRASVEASLEAVYAPYTKDSLLAIHIGNIEKMYRRLSTSGKKCIVLLYPDLYDMALPYSILANKNMSAALISKGIPCIDLSPLAERLPQNERMVNNMDAHPGVEMNAIFADSLYQHFKNTDWLK